MPKVPQIFQSRGFTLIELLVVIALIGTLSALLFANFNAARERSRDAQRKSDLRNIQTALRLYYNDYMRYPQDDNSHDGTFGRILGCGVGGLELCDWNGTWIADSTTYMSTLPRDPLDQAGDSSNDYLYSQVSDDEYLLRACLENRGDEKGRAATDTIWCPSGWMYEVSP